MRKKRLRISSLFYFQPRTAEGKSMTKEAKTTRNLKVIEQSGYRYQATPTVMLKGKWLSEFGFEIGTHVKVECENGKLIITKEEVMEEIVQPVLCVAEGKAGYGKKKTASKQRREGR